MYAERPQREEEREETVSDPPHILIILLSLLTILLRAASFHSPVTFAQCMKVCTVSHDHRGNANALPIVKLSTKRHCIEILLIIFIDQRERTKKKEIRLQRRS